MNLKWTQAAPTEFRAKWLEVELTLFYEAAVKAWRLVGAGGKKCSLRWPTVAKAMDAVDAEVERQLRCANVTAVQLSSSATHITKHPEARVKTNGVVLPNRGVRPTHARA
jgi:hypothetical protein